MLITCRLDAAARSPPVTLASFRHQYCSADRYHLQHRVKPATRRVVALPNVPRGRCLVRTKLDARAREGSLAKATRIRVEQQTFIPLGREQFWALLKELTPPHRWVELSPALACLESIYRVEYNLVVEEALKAYRDANQATITLPPSPTENTTASWVNLNRHAQSRSRTHTSPPAAAASKFDGTTHQECSNGSSFAAVGDPQSQQQSSNGSAFAAESEPRLARGTILGSSTPNNMRSSRTEESPATGKQEISSSASQQATSSRSMLTSLVQLESNSEQPESANWAAGPTSSTAQQPLWQEPAEQLIKLDKLVQEAAQQQGEYETAKKLRQEAEQEAAEKLWKLDRRFMELVWYLSVRAHFAPLGLRDILVSRSLNSDYLWQLFIKAGPYRLDNALITALISPAGEAGSPMNRKSSEGKNERENGRSGTVLQPSNVPSGATEGAQSQQAAAQQLKPSKASSGSGLKQPLQGPATSSLPSSLASGIASGTLASSSGTSNDTEVESSRSPLITPPWEAALEQQAPGQSAPQKVNSQSQRMPSTVKLRTRFAAGETAQPTRCTSLSPSGLNSSSPLRSISNSTSETGLPSFLRLSSVSPASLQSWATVRRDWNKLPEEAQHVLVLKRAYGQERQSGRLIIQKLDYLQLLLVRSVSKGIKEAVGVLVEDVKQFWGSMAEGRRREKMRVEEKRRENRMRRLSQQGAGASEGLGDEKTQGQELMELGGGSSLAGESGEWEEQEEGEGEMVMVGTRHATREQEGWSNSGTGVATRGDAGGRVNFNGLMNTAGSKLAAVINGQTGARSAGKGDGRAVVMGDDQGQQGHSLAGTADENGVAIAADTRVSSTAGFAKDEAVKAVKAVGGAAGVANGALVPAATNTSKTGQAKAGKMATPIPTSKGRSQQRRRQRQLLLTRVSDWAQRAGSHTVNVLVEWGLLPQWDIPSLAQVDRLMPVQDQRGREPQFLQKQSLEELFGGWDGFWGPEGPVRTLLSKVVVVEPTFKEMLVLYRSRPKGNRLKGWLSWWRPVPQPPQGPIKRPPIMLRIYHDIPMPTWKVVYPDKLLQFRPLDLIRLDLFAFTGLAAAIAEARYDSIILDVVSLTTFTVLAVRVVLGYKRMVDRYENSVNELLLEKTVAGNEGAVEYLGTSASSQQFKQAALAYTLLAGQGCSLDVGEMGRRAEGAISKASGKQVRFDVYEALSELRRLGLLHVASLPDSYRLAENDTRKPISGSATPQSLSHLVISEPSTVEFIVKGHWERLLWQRVDKVLQSLQEDEQEAGDGAEAPLPEP